MKKILVSLVVSASIILGMGATVFADNMQFKFVVSSDNNSDYSYSTQKSDATRLWYVRFAQTMPNYPEITSNWKIGETIRTRVRDNATRSAYSSAYSFTRVANYVDYGTSYERSYDLSVAPQAGGFYRLYCDRAASDSYGTLYLVGVWCP